MEKKSLNQQTMQILWVVVELLAVARSVVSTYAVTMAVSSGDQVFAVFTTGTIELAFLCMLFLIGFEAVAPIGALLALAFSAAMQFLEVQLMQGALDASSKNILMLVVSFAPSVILLLAYIKRLTGEDGFSSVVGLVGSVFGKRDKASGAEKSFGLDVPLNNRLARCSECGKEFDTVRRDALTCSAKCRRARARRLQG